MSIDFAGPLAPSRRGAVFALTGCLRLPRSEVRRKEGDTVGEREDACFPEVKMAEEGEGQNDEGTQGSSCESQRRGKGGFLYLVRFLTNKTQAAVAAALVSMLREGVMR